MFEAKARTVRRSAGQLRDELMTNQFLPSEELRLLTRRRSAEIAAFAARHTTFYREHFALHGVDVSALAEAESWEQVPIIDRSVVKERASDFHSDEARSRNTRSALTGGSTGEPLKVLHDARVPTLALAWRLYSWWGVSPWDNLARLARWSFKPIDSVKNTVSWWPSRQIYTDAALIDEQSLAALTRRVNQTRPALLEGYVGAMLEFAHHLKRNALTIPPPRAVATTAAPLTEDARAQLEDAFGAPVYDEYRGSEAGWMAGECAEQNGLHIFSDMRRIEVVDVDGQPAQPGEVGDIVVTDLTNRVFPLIRYRLGDRGFLLDHPCPCGVTLPLMGKPDGRTTDIVRMPSGKALNHRLNAMFSEHPEAVRLFQLHQYTDYSITVRVVATEVSDAQSQIERAVQALRDRISDEVPVRLEYVESLPYNRGKTKYVISDVAELA